MVRTRKEGDPNFSMGTSYNITLEDSREVEPQFTVLDLRIDVNSISLSSGVIEEIEEDMRFTLMTEVLEEQIDGIYKKMYPEDIVLLDKIKSEISENITIYTNMDNHLETKHTWNYVIRYGQQYGMFITRYISPYGKEFYILDIARDNINL